MTIDPDRRRRDMASIHIAKKQLGMDDETYRGMLWAVARVRSAADLDYTGLQRVLEHLRRSGFKAASGRTPDPEWAWVDTASEDRRPLLRKLIMLLRSAGRGRSYAEGIAEKMFHVDKLNFCSPDQLHKLVAALELDRRRRSMS